LLFESYRSFESIKTIENPTYNSTIKAEYQKVFTVLFFALTLKIEAFKKTSFKFNSTKLDKKNQLSID